MQTNLQILEICNLQPNAWNPNVMSQKEYLALKEDMEKSGPSGIDPLVVSSRTVFFGEKDEQTRAKLKHSQEILTGALGIKFAEYIIVDGEHRWKIAKELNWKTIACDVREITESEAKQICYRRNRERGTIDPFKEAALWKTEVDAGLTQQAIAEKYLVDRGTVSHRLSLIKLSSDVIDVVKKAPPGTLSVSHLEPVTSLSPAAQKKVAEWLEGVVTNDRPPTVKDVAWQAERAAKEEKEAHDLAEALKTAKYPKCPTCRQPPVKIYRSKKLPWVECPKGWDHAWNLKTGKRVYEPTPRPRTEKADKPKIPQTLRSAHTVQEIHTALIDRVKEAIPDLSISDIRISGKHKGAEVHIDITNYANSMGFNIREASRNFGFSAEKHDYKTGEKSSVHIGVYKPTQKDVDAVKAFIEHVLSGKPLFEAKP